MENWWVFNWNEGGYNSVRAKTREEALRKARGLIDPNRPHSYSLTVNESSLRQVTSQEMARIDASYN